MKISTFICAFSAVVYSGAVIAAPSGPTWDVIGTGAVGLIATFVMLWIKSVSDRQRTTEGMVAELQRAMLTQYHPKADIAEMIREVRNAVQDLRSENHRWQEKMEQKFAHLESIYGR